MRTLNESLTGAFFDYVRERYLIQARKESGKPKPWTTDPILQKYRFCCVFREDDKTTQWFKRRVREPLKSDPRVAFAAVLFRFINHIDTGEALLFQGLFTKWNPDQFKAVMNARKAKGKPMLGAAYMIKTPNGLDKPSGLCKIFEALTPDGDNAWLGHQVLSLPSLEALVAFLGQFPYLGPFMAYEVACDLVYTSFGFSPNDVYTWANPGPGARRGLNRLIFGTVGAPLGAPLTQAEMLNAMQYLLFETQIGTGWQLSWPAWDMRTVEHSCCEWDKYERTRLGEGTPKQKYQGV